MKKIEEIRNEVTSRTLSESLDDLYSTLQMARKNNVVAMIETLTKMIDSLNYIIDVFVMAESNIDE